MNCNTEYLYTSGSAWVHFEPVVSKRTRQIRWNGIDSLECWFVVCAAALFVYKIMYYG